MQALKKDLNLDCDKRASRSENLLRNLKSNANILETLNKWGVRIGDEQIHVKASTYKSAKVTMAADRTVGLNLISKNVRYGLFKARELNRILFVCPKFLERSCEMFWSSARRSIQGIEARESVEKLILRTNSTSEYIERLRNHSNFREYQLVIR